MLYYVTLYYARTVSELPRFTNLEINGNALSDIGVDAIKGDDDDNDDGDYGWKKVMMMMVILMIMMMMVMVRFYKSIASFSPFSYSRQ